MIWSSYKFYNKSIFVISTGRTGTVYFQNYFNRNIKNIISVHEPKPDLFNLSIEKYRFQKNISQKNIYSNRKEYVEKGKLYCESNPFISYLIPEINKTFPNAQFIFIVRDPITYLTSIFNKKNEVDGQIYYPYSESDMRKRLNPLDFKNDKWQNHWGRFNRYEKLAWYWQKTNSVILNDLENLGPNKSIMLKYEHIFHKNKLIKTESFEKINQFLNIEISDNLISNKKLNSQNADIFNQDEFNESLDSINEIIKDVKNVLKY